MGTPHTSDTGLRSSGPSGNILIGLGLGAVFLLAGLSWSRLALSPQLRSQAMPLGLRKATIEDWPAIERILRTDHRLVETKDRVDVLHKQLREDPRYRFYLLERGHDSVGMISIVLGEQITFRPFYLVSEDITLEEVLPLVLQILVDERKDGRAVITEAYAEVLPLLQAFLGEALEVRPLTDQGELFEITIRHHQL